MVIGCFETGSLGRYFLTEAQLNAMEKVKEQKGLKRTI